MKKVQYEKAEWRYSSGEKHNDCLFQMPNLTFLWIFFNLINFREKLDALNKLKEARAAEAEKKRIELEKKRKIEEEEAKKQLEVKRQEEEAEKKRRAAFEAEEKRRKEEDEKAKAVNKD